MRGVTIFELIYKEDIGETYPCLFSLLTRFKSRLCFTNCSIKIGYHVQKMSMLMD